MKGSQLHVGLLTPSFAGASAVGSGIGVHFRHLAEGLMAAGHAVTAIVPVEADKAKPTDEGYLQVLPVTVPPMAKLLGRVSWQFHQWSYERALRRAAAQGARTCPGIDVWETTSTGAPALPFLDVRPRSPIVTRVSTTASQLRTTNEGPPNWLTRQHERQERAAIAGSDAVITHSASHRDAIAREFGLTPASIPIIPHGIPLPVVSERAPRPEVELLFVGRLEHRKGIDLLLGALPAVFASSPAIHATLVGTDSGGYWQAHWNTIAPAAVRERITFTGAVSDQTLAAHYARADVFVAPSRYESFGLMFVEAMAWKLPVVALAAPGANEILVAGQTALLTPPDDIPALAAAINRLAGDSSLRRQLADAGRQRAEARYSRAALTEASVAYYRALLAKVRIR